MRGVAATSSSAVGVPRSMIDKRGAAAGDLGAQPVALGGERAALRIEAVAVGLREGGIEHRDHVALAHRVAGAHAQRAQHGAGGGLQHHGRHIGRQPARRGHHHINPQEGGGADQAQDQPGGERGPEPQEPRRRFGHQRVERILKGRDLGGQVVAAEQPADHDMCSVCCCHSPR